MDKHTAHVPRKMPWVAISVITTIIAVLLLVLMVMPKGFKTTHEQIGTGKPAVVFVYDANFVSSTTQTVQMNEARDQLGENVFFLLARAGTPEGDLLIAKYNARPAELLLFDAAGSLTKRQLAVVNANELMLWMR